MGLEYFFAGVAAALTAVALERYQPRSNVLYRLLATVVPIFLNRVGRYALGCGFFLRVVNRTTFSLVGTGVLPRRI